VIESSLCFCSSHIHFCFLSLIPSFRHITYYPDRPDNLAVFDRVRIEADKENYPVLLGNGNKIEEGACEDGRHFAVWQDPYPKPSYLFCIVVCQYVTFISQQLTLRDLQ